MKIIANIFFKGLLFTLPIVATFGFLYWLFDAAETLLKYPLELILPSGWYITGMGVISTLAIVFLIGLLAQAYLIKHIFSAFEQLLERIPIVKTFYVSVRSLLQFIAGGKGGDLQKVVAFSLNDNIRLIGFVTNENAQLGERSNLLAVYLPMSYQVGGYLIYVPREKCEILDMPVREAMQQVLTADIGLDNHSR